MTRAKIKTPITYYGGKQQMLKHILPMIPEHKIYTEAFAGGLAVFWAKEPSSVEVINDIDGEIVNFYRVVQSQFDELNILIASTLLSRQSYEDAMIIYNRPHMFNEINRAWAFWMLTSQGFAAKIGSWGYDRSGHCARSLGNRKARFNEELIRRLEKTQIECNDANRVIYSRDTNETFHYVDTPYIDTNQGHYSGYSEDQFKSTLDILAHCHGKFMLSSYPSELLETYRENFGWTSYKFDKQLAAGKSGKNRKVEVITVNYETGIGG